jgi:hypothetical protein
MILYFFNDSSLGSNCDFLFRVFFLNLMFKCLNFGRQYTRKSVFNFQKEWMGNIFAVSHPKYQKLTMGSTLCHQLFCRFALSD